MFFAVLGGVILFGICVLGTVFDALTAIYFHKLDDNCGDGLLSEDRCFCASSEDSFQNIFQEVGDIDCYNPYTRNTSYLIANAALSGLCAVVSAYLLVATLGGLVMILCGCGGQYEQVQGRK